MRRLALMGPIYLLLVVLSASTVRGAECEDPTPVAAFSPGQWIARGIQIYREAPDDGLSTVYVAGTGGFNLNIDGSGMASGLFHLDGKGTVQASNEFDGGYLDVKWAIDGDLSGTGLRIVVDGTQQYAFQGAVDSNPSGDGDEWSGSGNDIWGFGNQTDEPYRSAFSPSSANCNQVFGSLDGPVSYGSANLGSEAYFLAVRVPGSSMPEVDIESELVALLEDAQEILTMYPLDTDRLAQFVLDVMAFSSLIASLEHCDFAETRAGPAWDMLRTVLVETADRLLAAATAGSYATVDVVDAMATILQGGVLGWRGHDCVESASDDAAVLFTRFEDLLLQRLQLTLQMSNVAERMAEVKVISTAAYQFGMDRVIAYLEGEMTFPEPEVIPDA